MVRCAQPIEVRRSHISGSAGGNEGAGLWRIQREAITLYVGVGGGYPRFWVERADGRVTTFIPDSNWGIGKNGSSYWRGRLDHNVGRIANTSHGELSGRSNPHTIFAEFESNRNRFIITRGDGEVSYYYKGETKFSTNWSAVYKKKNSQPVEEVWCLGERKLPNGNWLFYSHNRQNEVTRIESYAPDRKTRLGRVDFTYEKRSISWPLPLPPGADPRIPRIITRDYDEATSRIHVKASDGQELTYIFEEGQRCFSYEPHNPAGVWPLVEVHLPDGSVERYNHTRKEGYGSRLAICQTGLNHYSGTHLHYYQAGDKIDRGTWTLKRGDDRLGRIKSLYATTGRHESAVEVERYSYDSYIDRKKKQHFFAYVDDAIGLRTYYHHTSDKLPLKVGNSADDITTERIWWSSCGNLTTKVLYLNPYEPLLRRSLHYDYKGNVLRETLTGDLSGKGEGVIPPQDKVRQEYPLPKEGEGEIHTIHRTYSNDWFNLCLTEEDGPLRTEQEFLPKTDLITRKVIYYNQELQEEWIYRYNEHHQLIEEEHHNGPEKTLTTITRIEKGIHIGLPGKKAHFSLGKQKRLLGKTHYRYNPQNLCIAEEIYDATNTLRYTLTYTYDKAGRLLSKSNPLGHTTEYLYDRHGNCIEERPPGGHYTKHSRYDWAHRLVQTALYPTDDSPPLITQFAYDPMNHKTDESDIYGNWTHYKYDPKGRLIQIALPEATEKEIPCKRISYGWDAKRKNIELLIPQKIHEDQPLIQKKYDPQDRLIEEINPLGESTRWKYNSRGQPTEITYPDGTSKHTLYDLRGQIIEEKSPTGAITKYTRNYKGDPLTIHTYTPQGELLSEQSYTYEGSYKTSSTDPTGITTHYTYNPAGQLIEERTEERITRYGYDPLGRKTTTEIRDPETLIRREITLYDLAGQPIEERIEDAAGTLLTRKTTQYDPDGNPESTTTHDGEKTYTTHTQYDPLRRPLTITDPLGQTTTYTYDAKIPLTTIIDPLKRTTKIYHDLRGNIQRQEIYDPDGILLSLTTQEYDPADQKIAETHHALHQGKAHHKTHIQWEWGPNGQLKALHEGDGKTIHRTTRYEYNDQGLLATTHKPDGTPHHKEYDSRGLLTTHRGPDFHYQYTYDARGRWTHIAHTEGETHRTYTPYGEIQSETLAHGGTTHYTYDPAGRCTQITLSQGPQIHYHYGALHLQKVEHKDTHGTTHYTHHYHTYDQRGQILQEEGEGIPTTRSYDPLGRPLTLQTPTYTEEVTQYRPDGALLSHTITDPLGTLTQQYEYDHLSQLIREKGVLEESYIYDSLHNRLQEKQYLATHTPLNELQKDYWGEYHYDPNGRPILWKRKGEELYLQYDTLDRLTTLTTENLQLTFTYDPLDRRLTKEIHIKEKEEQWQLHAHQTFLYQNECEIGSLGPQGELLELRILGLGRGMEIGATLALQLEGTHYTAHSSLRGSIVQLIDPQGQVASTTRYSAYGIPQGETLSPWGFMGKRLDREVDWVYFGRRHYLPHQGRWLTPDPKGYPEGPNLYAYCYNRLFSCLDPIGLSILNAEKKLQAPPLCPKYEPLFGDYPRPCHRFSPLSTGCHKLGMSLGCCSDLGGLSSGLITFGMLGEGFRYEETPYGRDLPTAHAIGCTPENQEGPFALYINGMNTPLDYARETASYFSQESGLPILLVHNPSHGGIADFLSCMWGKAGGGCRASRFAERAFRVCAEEAEKMGIDTLPLICHSQGCILTAQALGNCEPSVCNKLAVRSFGAPHFIPNKAAADVINYRSSRDPIPYFAPLALLSVKLGMDIYRIDKLPPSPGMIFDHGIRNPCYSQKIIRSLEEFK